MCGFHSPSLHLLIRAEECGSLAQSSRQALGSSWRSSSPFSVAPDLGAIIAEQLLEVDPSAHLVFDVKEKNICVDSFDMHLLDGWLYGDVVGCHRWCREKKRRKEGKLENLEMWLGPACRCAGRELGRARPHAGVGRICC